MSTYLVQSRYIGNGPAGVIKDGGAGRYKALKTAVEALGGKVLAFYFSLGEWDGLASLDLPSYETAQAFLSGLNNRSSGVIDVRYTPLISPEEFDAAREAAAKSTATPWRPPGA
jgi:uncharacterized protein with GYD domain